MARAVIGTSNVPIFKHGSRQDLILCHFLLRSLRSLAAWALAVVLVDLGGNAMPPSGRRTHFTLGFQNGGRACYKRGFNPPVS